MATAHTKRAGILGVRSLVGLLAATTLVAGASPHHGGATSLAAKLRSYGHKILWERYVDGNWEIFAMNADGSHKVNLTKTPHRNEHYPQISPDGRKIAFSVDEGEGRDAVRSLWVMDITGRHPRKLVDHAREPFWAPDSKTIGYLPQEYPKFDVMDFYTSGMCFYHLDTGVIERHPNSANLRHLYNPCFSSNGKWIVATVHAGMGFSHTILLIEAHGSRIIDLKIPGCRPNLSPDGKHIAWGPGDHELAVAPIDLSAQTPVVGPWSLHIKDDVNKIYHISFSPDGRYVAFSRGPDGEGDLTKPGTFAAAAEIVGVHARGWNICVVPTHGASSIVDLQVASPSDFAQLTTDGESNKEPTWTGVRSGRHG